MHKLLLFILALVAIFYVRRLFLRSVKPDQAVEAPPQTKAVEPMRECKECGILVPESEAVRVRDEYFCSLEHAQSAQADRRS